MDRLFFFILFMATIFYGPIKAQNAVNDSLHQLLFEPTDDSTRVARIHKYVERIIFVDMDSTLKYLSEAEALSLKRGDSLQLSIGYDFMGRAYNSRGAYQVALEYVTKSNRLIERHGGRTMFGRSKISMGLLYHSMGEYIDALRIFEEAREILEEEKDSTRVALAYLNIGGCLSNLERTDEALDALDRIFDFVPADDPIAAFANNNIGYNYYQSGQYEEAIPFYEKALEQKRRLFGGGKEGTTLNNLAEVHTKLGKFKEAERYAREADEVTERFQSVSNILGNLNTWSQLYAAKKDFKRAYEYLLQHKELNDSLHSSDMKEQVAQLQVAYQSERKQNQIEMLNQENELLVQENKTQTASRQRQNIFIIALVGGLLSLAIIAALLWMNNQTRKRSNELLVRKNEEIESHRQNILAQNRILKKLNYEKDGLMAIVAHDLKSPISKTRGLIQMVNSSRNMREEEIIDKMDSVLQSAQDLIDELVLISQVESQEEPVEMKAHLLSDILSQQSAQFAGAAARKSIQLEITDLPQDIRIRTQVDYLNRVLDNLISNALKFSPQQSKIQITVEEVGKYALINIADNGPGIPKEELPKLFRKFSRLSPQPTGGESSSGLGLYIVKTLTERVLGKIEVETEVGKGSIFKIYLPLA